MHFVTWKEIKELRLVPYTRQHWDRLVARKLAPQKRKRGNRVVWVLEEVLAWQATYFPPV